jgi:hypothetical protein
MTYPVRDIIVTYPYNGTTHRGVDLRTKHLRPHEVIATSHGKVIKNQWHAQYGWMVDIEHEIGYVDRYAHLAYKCDIHVGGGIKKGARVGIPGNTGNSFGEHLHYEVFKNKLSYRIGLRTNPLVYLKNKIKIMTMDRDDVITLWRAVVHADPQESEINQWTGKTFDQVIHHLLDDPKWKEQNFLIKDYLRDKLKSNL